ncbi:MAG: bacillithiol biosynthesis cysteine-adding enzyme BshC [Terriglobus sp.]
MNLECYPITVLPHLSRLFVDYTELRPAAPDAAVRRFFAASPFDERWMQGRTGRVQPECDVLVDALTEQAEGFGCSDTTFANLEKLRNGAKVVVTGQQVGLLGGPLLTLMKAATAIRKAQIASERGVPHVPVFWMATEDHDLDEVNQAALLTKHGVETLRSTFPQHKQQPVGDLVLGPQIEAVVERAEELLAYAPITELLRSSYTPQDTLASAFGKFIAGVFAEFGLIVIDASTRAFHQMGAQVLRHAIEHADELHAAIAQRGRELADAGYASQVLVHDDSTLLFVVEEDGNRVALKRVAGSSEWKAGSRVYSAEELLAILDAAPERISPNALLRPVFQDAILPTSAYIGGPAEIAYFAQLQPVYDAILGEPTPILPRLSGTLVPASIRTVMDQHEVSFKDALTTADALAQRLAARAMPIEGKRKIAAAGNALDEELKTVEQWMSAMDQNLGHSATIAANKMRYQMNRLRRLAANWQLERETFLAKHATAITLNLYPKQHIQERLLSGAQLLAVSTVDLATLLVENAELECPGHRVLDI